MGTTLMWDYVASLIIPFQVVLFLKLIVLFIYNFDSLTTFYSFTSFLTTVLFSSPVSLIAFILLFNWFAHYFYLLFIVLILSPCLSCEAWRLFYLGFVSQIPLSLDFIELFMYIYIGTVYILGLLVSNEAVFELKACLLIFVAFRLNHLILCWQFSCYKPTSESTPLMINEYHSQLRTIILYPSVLILSSFCLMWPFSISIILGSKLYFEFDLLAFNTIGSVTILLFLIHVHLSLLTFRTFVVNTFIKSPSLLYNENRSDCLQKLIFLLFITLELMLFIFVLVFASRKFYYSELSLTSTGYAKISTHVIFSTIFFCLIYLNRKLWPELVCLWRLLIAMNQCSSHQCRLDWSIFASRNDVHNRCGLCLVPVFRTHFDSSFITHSPLLNCFHFFHQSCANVCGLLSLPCLQCRSDLSMQQQTSHNLESFDRPNCNLPISDVSSYSLDDYGGYSLSLFDATSSSSEKLASTANSNKVGTYRRFDCRHRTRYVACFSDDSLHCSTESLSSSSLSSSSSSSSALSSPLSLHFSKSNVRDEHDE